MKFIKSLYIHKQLYIYLAVVSVCFLMSYWFPVLYSLAWILITIVIVLLFIDLMFLYGPKNGIDARRLLPEKFSNSDNNPVPITINSSYNFKTFIDVIDELPMQFQKRDFSYKISLNLSETHNFEYAVRPIDRGEYYFGYLNIFASSILKIIKRRYRFQNEQMVMVYPSIIQMQKYDFLAISNSLTQIGQKKIRRIGHTSEFEQIKEYVLGDDLEQLIGKLQPSMVS